MRICFDYQIFSFQQYGGVSRYIFEIANHMAGMVGQDVRIFAPLYVNEYFHNSNKVRPTGIKISPSHRLSRLIKSVNLTTAHLMIKPRRNVDIFHETYYSLSDFCPSSAKRLITVYDMIHEKFADNFPGGDKMLRIKAYAVKRADHVICISQNTQRDLVEIMGVPEEKTSVVYLGHSIGSKESESKPAVITNPYILYVGRREGYKNFEKLLHAYADSSLLKNEFNIVCFGGGGFSTRESGLMQSLNLSRTRVIHMSGGDDLLGGLFASAALFVYPSLYEGFGLSPLEAMAFGCPVVCANSSCLPEVVGDAAELFDPADAYDMRMAIEKVVLSPELASLLAERGRERIKLYSWEKCARETLKVYQKVLQG